MAYSQIETRGQFVRLLGLGASSRDLTRRWEKNPTDVGAQRPGAVSLRRMLYLVVWQMTGILYIYPISMKSTGTEGTSFRATS